VEVVALLSQGRTDAAQCGLFTHKSVPVIFEPPCNIESNSFVLMLFPTLEMLMCFLEQFLTLLNLDWILNGRGENCMEFT